VVDVWMDGWMDELMIPHIDEIHCVNRDDSV
jgi:hypothetical protein